MHFSSIARVLGTLLLVTGGSMLFPLLCALYYNEGDFNAILISGMITSALGLPLWWFFRRNYELRAWQKITCHFRIPSSGHLHPILNPKVLEIAHYSCGFELSDRTNLT